MITGTIYQVVAIVVYKDGDESVRSHGFFDSLRQAEQIRDSICEQMFIGLDDEEWRCFINEIHL